MTTTPRRRARTLLGAGLVAFAVPAAGLAAPAAQASDDGEKNTLIVGTSGLGNIPHMNPLDSGWLIQGELNNLMYDPMIRFSQDDYAPAPGLAAEWESSEDELTWTYRMNPEATWSDGEPVTAEDAVFTYQTIIDDPILRSRHGELVDNFTSVEAVDEHTLQIEVAEPSALMAHLNGVGIMIMPEHVWSEIDNPGEYYGEPGQPTSGAFELAEFNEGENVVLTANPNYWNGPVAYDEFILQNYETPEAMVQALQAGDVDLIGSLNPQQYAALDELDTVTTSTGPGRRLQSIGFNAGAQTQDGEEFGDGHPALQDPEVRRAIHHVIDKERLVEVAMDGFAIPGLSYVPPVFADYAWEPGDELVEVSTEEGNRILDEAGYDERDANGTRIDPESGEPLEFRLFYHSDRPTYAIMKDFIVDWVAELDIVLDDQALDTTPLNEEVEGGNFDLAFGTWNPGPDPTGTLVYHTCDRLPEEVQSTDLTFSFYCNEEFDALFDEQLAEGDVDARADLVRRMQSIVYDEAPAIILYYENQLEAFNSDRWGGFTTQPTAGGMIREQQGSFGYESAVPADQLDDAAQAGTGGEEAEAASDDGPGATMWIIIAAVIVVAGALLFLVRRQRTSDDRE